MNSLLHYLYGDVPVKGGERVAVGVLLVNIGGVAVAAGILIAAALGWRP